jgi:hypothetical protein
MVACAENLRRRAAVVYEMLIYDIAPERRADYVQSWGETWKKVERPGCRGVRSLSCIEKPERVIIEIAWDSVQDHENARQIPGHGMIRELTAAFGAEGEGAAHYTIQDL